MRILDKVIVLALFVFTSESAPFKKKKEFPKVPSAQSLDFMKKYGYLEDVDGESEALYSEDGISNALKTLQRFGNIPQTGKFDNATLKLMSSQRCGVPDIIRDGRRQKRFALAPRGWEKRHLTYFVANWSPHLDEYTVTNNIQKALDIWGKYGHLEFSRSSSPEADIIVAFGRGHHGDMFPFDGRGNILAHAFFPNDGLGGDIHFDDDELWSDTNNGVGSSDGTDFFTVALHELGHSLGLQHSPVSTSIMFPYYKGFDKNPVNLDYDDILGMYEMYIRRPINDTDPFVNSGEHTTPREVTTRRQTTRKRTTTERPSRRTTRYEVTDYYPTRSPETRNTESSTRYYYGTPNSTPRRNINTVSYEGDFEEVDDHLKHDPTVLSPESPPSLPTICDGFFDAVASLRGDAFIFKDKYIWRLKRFGQVEQGYPVTLKDMFPTLPTYIEKIDAAYQRPDGMIILFTDNLYWVHDGQDFIENSPRPISDYGLPNSLNKIDAVFNWVRNHKTYIFKNDRFWRYNESTKAMDEGYPLHMERWRGVPMYLNAATTWNGETYFFKNELYWKFDSNEIQIAENSPLPIGEVWLGCPENIKKMNRLFGN